MKTINMTIDEWSLVPENPIQRDTERHAAQAEKTHLKNFSPTHARVAAAELPDGRLIKLDGHTRLALWKSGKLNPPDILHVDVYPVKNLKETEELYKCFDNQSASEKASDRLFGAFRLHEIRPMSRLLTQGGVTYALNMLTSRAPIYQSVGQFKNQLLQLDEINMAPEKAPAPIIAAAIITLAARGERIIPFWEKYRDEMGQRYGGESCPVDALSRLVIESRARRKMTGHLNLITLAEKSISAAEAWIAGRNYTNGIKSTDLKSYMQKHYVKPKE